MSDLQLTKRCLGTCQRELPATLEYFNAHAHGKYGLQARCKDCKREELRRADQEHPERKAARDKRYAAKHPEKRKAIHAKHRTTPKWKKTLQKNWLRTKYNMTEEDYQKMFDSQNGLCAICGFPEKDGKRLHIDHDHLENKVRALLCGKCNRGVGMFNEDESLLQKAIDYLRFHKS
jgi:hypothetical protein